MPAIRAGGVMLGLVAACWSFPAGAQQSGAEAAAQAEVEGRREIAFEANQLSYDTDNDVVTAEGNVILRSGEHSVRADRVSWDRKTGQVTASGSIRYVDGDGNVLYTDNLTLTDDLRLGAMDNMLLALREGGRIAAREGMRGEDGNVELAYASYSACAVEDENGCPKTPSWRIVAERVIYEPEANRVRFKGATMEIFGQRIVPLPGLVVTTDGRAISGFTVPDLRFSDSNGLEISQGYYLRLADNQDLTGKVYVYTEAPPMFSAQYRALLDEGAFQVTGYATRSARIPIGPEPGTQQQDWRGYLFTNGKWQFSPEWSLTASARIASDRTFLRRYDISREDRLRSTFNLERIDENSYLSISGWATQTLRFGDPQGQVPLALPLIDYRRRIDDPLLGGKVELQLNSLAITRTEGQDTQRAFAGARWDLRRITGM
ncbi:MAG TPA: LPS assembly protein LptD, partial [Sphingomonadaceae bacterium]|nr:LPS assembly protein LptD [Sphingomonadaceae bacterium]